MAQTHCYEVEVTWRGGRIGSLSAPNLNDRITCATPPEFPNGVPGIWSPEHLYAASLNSCFMVTFIAMAEKSKLKIRKFSCKVIAKLEMKEGVYQISEANLFPEVEAEEYEKYKKVILLVLQKAKKGCLIANSMKTQVSMDPEIREFESEKNKHNKPIGDD